MIEKENDSKKGIKIYYVGSPYTQLYQHNCLQNQGYGTNNIL